MHPGPATCARARDNVGSARPDPLSVQAGHASAVSTRSWRTTDETRVRRSSGCQGRGLRRRTRQQGAPDRLDVPCRECSGEVSRRWPTSSASARTPALQAGREYVTPASSCPPVPEPGAGPCRSGSMSWALTIGNPAPHGGGAQLGDPAISSSNWNACSTTRRKPHAIKDYRPNVAAGEGRERSLAGGDRRHRQPGPHRCRRGCWSAGRLSWSITATSGAASRPRSPA